MKTISSLLLITLISLFSACKTIEIAPSSGLQHVVLLWLKDPGNTEDRKQIVEVSKTFAEIPSVANVRVGQVIPSDRAIVDSSFDVGIIVSVDNQQGLKEYLDHPIHQQAKNEVLLPLVEKILVYDFED